MECADVTTSRGNRREDGWLHYSDQEKSGDIRATNLVKVTKLGENLKPPKRGAKFLNPSCCLQKGQN